jgi:predicted phosphodiesterase
MLIAGHTHKPVFPEAGTSLYFNDGCCIHTNGATGIEIVDGEISLIKWSMKVRSDGSLYVGKNIIAEANKLIDYF